MNYDNLCIEILNKQDKSNKKKLLLHACCAPCSSAVLTRLASFFDITILFYNPNITDFNEYLKRKEELVKFLKKIKSPIKVIETAYDNELFLKMSKGLEDEKEGGKRCYKCYYLRLEETAKVAHTNNFDYFTTTLSISPYKNSTWLNEIGKELEEEYKVKYLYADFKKQDGYKKSLELSRKYGLYRQDYCGCIYSKTEKIKKQKEKEQVLNCTP